MKLRHSADTDVGKTRDHNEDSFGVGADEQAERLGNLLVVCDGMGGHAAGEVASKIGVDTILSLYYQDQDVSGDRAHVLEHAFEQANELIYARGHGSMGTTGVAALLIHDALHIANVGDSRAYLIRGGEIRQISRDHSFVGDQVAAGLITADQARSSPHRNVITRALGYQSGVTVDMFSRPLQLDDVIVLCSDGLHGLVSDAEIAQIAGANAPEDAVRQLIDLANSRGGTDNITVAIARVDQLDWYGGEQAEPEDLQERVTVELPVTGAHATPDQQPEVAPPPAPIETAPPPAPPAAQPAERRLTLLGGLLALLLLAALVGIIYFAMSAPTVLAPAPATAPAASPVAATAQTTAGPTAAATAGPTAEPTPAATAGPTAEPTPAATAEPTSAPATAPARATIVPTT